MEYKALITRMYSMADESLQIIVPNTTDINEFKTRIFTALKVCDYRAHTQMLRLFEDTDLINTLNYDELKVARTATKIMYPAEAVPAKLDLGQGTTDYETSYGPAFEFSKNMASGEVLKIFLHRVDTYEDMSTAIKAVWDIIDTRLAKTNKRELDFIDYFKNQPYTIRLKVTKIMDILFGRSLKETVVEELRGFALEQLKQEMTTEAKNS